MRFINWDCLLFPLGDNTPIHEFKPEFCFISDPDMNFENGGARARAVEAVTASHLCSVTTYVPMLRMGIPFQMSIHSWRPPVVESIDRAGDKIPMLEFRLFVNGKPITYVILPPDGPWPLVIGSYPSGGRSNVLNFPPFNFENMTNGNHWEVEGNTIGLMISEGYVIRGAKHFKYYHSKNVVSFAFHYAPLELLQSLGIAYPPPLIQSTFESKHPSGESLKSSQGFEIYCDEEAGATNEISDGGSKQSNDHSESHGQRASLQRISNLNHEGTTPVQARSGPSARYTPVPLTSGPVAKVSSVLISSSKTSGKPIVKVKAIEDRIVSRSSSIGESALGQLSLEEFSAIGEKENVDSGNPDTIQIAGPASAGITNKSFKRPHPGDDSEDKGNAMKLPKLDSFNDQKKKARRGNSQNGPTKRTRKVGKTGGDKEPRRG